MIGEYSFKLLTISRRQEPAHDVNTTSLFLLKFLNVISDTGPGPLTLFAPDNAAFKKLPKGALDALLKDKYKLIGMSHLKKIKIKELFGNLIFRSHDNA